LTAGAAYLFTETGNQWNQQQKLSDFHTVHGEFGYSVAVSATDIAVGAPFTSAICGSSHAPAGYDSLANVGLVDVYTYSAGSVVRNADRLFPLPSTKSAQFGLSVALSGTHLAVGAPNATVPAQFQVIPGQSSSNSGLVSARISSVSAGAAFLYNKVTTGATVTWTPVSEFNADDGLNNDHYGWSLALNGNTLYVGAPDAKAHDLLGDSQGGLYVYTPDSAGKYHEAVKLIAHDGANGDGYAQALAVTGVTAVAGAPSAKINANAKQGAVYFEIDGSLAVSTHMPASISTAGSFYTTVTVTNNTAAATAPLTVSLPAPTGATATVVTATTNQGTCAVVSSTYTCTLNAIPANGGTATITVTVMVSGGTIGGMLSETATITNTTPTVSGTGTTHFASLSNYSGSRSGTGRQDFWSLGFLASLLMLRFLPFRRRDLSG
jgi:hypothetical protein